MSEFIKELWVFLRVRKKFWLLPILLIFLTLGSVLLATQSSAIAPFIYSIF